ncbi:MAG TPA: hypothetical protein VGW38_24150, partial [Chloroflexota bacterium]|nr:hypothetical protein [Chloroflexota bacterium]
ALDPAAVQEQLGISKSQYYREQTRALAGLASVLAERWQRLGREGVEDDSASGVLEGPKFHSDDSFNGTTVSGSAADQATSAQDSGLVMRGGATNLPCLLSTFVGRAEELAQIRQLLGRGCLVSLVGPGGIGKTRLALESAVAVLPAFPDGVWLVDLAPVADPVQVPPSVASVLGVREDGRRLLTDALVDALRSKRLMLVLDNCEHLIEACAQLVDALLRGCRYLHILVTSREPLAVTGETIWRVPPLSLPGLRGSEDSVQPEALAENEAVKLFLERARAVEPHFSLTDANALAVARLCRQLDGIPLAIELAAARLRVLSVGQVLAHLHDRFRLLTGGSRTALPRHQTLLATLDWSYQLLNESEQTLFNRLSVFAGGFTLEAAQAVCAATDINADEVLDVLTRLVDKSLVMVDGQIDGTVRFRLLETIRHYARQRLTEVEEAAGIQRCHATYYLSLAEIAEPKLFGAEQVPWLHRLSSEQGNLRASLAWSLLPEGEINYGLRFANALWWFWHLRGRAGEGSRWLEALLARSVAVPDVLRAKALCRAGHLDWDLGNYQTATTLLSESVDLAERLKDHGTIGLALVSLS